MAKLADTDTPRFPNPEVTTDAGKNQRAANQLHGLMKMCIRQCRRSVRRASGMLAQAPGDRDTVIGLLDASQQVEMNAFLKKLKALANDLRETDTPSLSEAVVTPQTDRNSKNVAADVRAAAAEA